MRVPHNSFADDSSCELEDIMGVCGACGVTGVDDLVSVCQRCPKTRCMDCLEKVACAEEIPDVCADCTGADIGTLKMTLPNGLVPDLPLIQDTVADSCSACLGSDSDTTVEEHDTRFTPPPSPLQSIVHQTEELLFMMRMTDLELYEKDHAEEERLRAEIKVLGSGMVVMQRKHDMTVRTLEIEKSALKEAVVNITWSLEQSVTRVKMLEENIANLTQSFGQAQATIKTMKAEQKLKSKKEQKKEAKLKALKELVGGL